MILSENFLEGVFLLLDFGGRNSENSTFIDIVGNTRWFSNSIMCDVLIKDYSLLLKISTTPCNRQNVFR